MKYRHLFGQLYNTPHCIHPDKLQEISAAFIARLEGVTAYSAAEIAEMRAAAEPPKHEPGQDIAVLPLWGTMYQHSSMMTSGGTSTAKFGQQFRQALRDPQVGTILLHINSPGGSVPGTQELSQLIFDSRGVKNIVGHVNSMMASAALWVGTACSELVMTPSGEGGSLGVYCMHVDESKFEESMGFKTTLIATPSKKVAGNPFEPLAEETRAEIEAENNRIYDQFAGDVARNRGMKTGRVKTDFGGGGMLNAQDALAAGMIDKIDTFEATIDRILSGGKKGKRGGRSYANALAIAALDD